MTFARIDHTHSFWFDELARDRVLADLSVELTDARKQIANLEIALQTSRTIAIAVGILVERFKMTPDAAFRTLATASQHAHRKVRDIASDLIFSGELQS